MENCGTALEQSLHATPEESLTSKESHMRSFSHMGHGAVSAQEGGGTKMKLSVFRKGDSLDSSRGLHYQASFSLFQQAREEAFLLCGPHLPPKSYGCTGS